MQMWKWKRHAWNSPHVVPVEVDRTTAACVVFPNGRRAAKVQTSERYFATESKAWEFEHDSAVKAYTAASAELARARDRREEAERRVFGGGE